MLLILTKEPGFEIKTRLRIFLGWNDHIGDLLVSKRVNDSEAQLPFLVLFQFRIKRRETGLRLALGLGRLI
jgi:hypothetical protein